MNEQEYPNEISFHFSREHQYDESGNLIVKNISAYWIPDLTIRRKIGGTVYTVTGSYEGNENFIRKLERITAKNFAEKLE